MGMPGVERMSTIPRIAATPEPFSQIEIARFYEIRAPKIPQVGKEWRGPCPIHNGQHDSFAVNPETGDWYCHSKCGRGGSLFDLEIELSGKPFAQAASDARALVGKGAQASRQRIVSTYDYENEFGELLFQCVRYKPKRFCQRRPDGHGDWIWNLDGVPRVLFRLPTLKRAELVLVTEGEKDALNLVRLGFIATCNPMGASKWLPEYSDQLAGKHVVLFPDNDKPGQAHMTCVGRSVFGKAASVRVVTVPTGKDVSDWIAAGAAREEIQAVIDDAAPFVDFGRAEGSTGEKDWRSALLRTARGVPKAVLANAITALRHAPEWSGVLGFNEFTLSTVALKPPPWRKSGGTSDWTDQEDRLAADWLQHEGICVSIEVASQAVQAVAPERIFHPVRNYIEGLLWDSVPRIDYWLNYHLGVELNPYSAAVGSKWLISAVARIYRPGVKADCCLILEGKQGIRKSTALKVLAGAWFTDEIADLGSKDSAMQTRGVWIIEIAELDSMSKTEVGKLKAFMSRGVDRFRPPYGRRLAENPRQCIFAGSVNHTTYLRDETGGRRFWPVSCGEIHIDELQRDRDQLWAEARERFLSDEPWWLDSSELIEQAEAEQAYRCEDDPWQEKIASWIESRSDVSITEILTSRIEKPCAQWTQSDKTRVARCLTALGWQRYKSGPRAKREWRYRPE
jgi:predicted P-loop ATPase